MQQLRKELTDSHKDIETGNMQGLLGQHA